MQIETIFYTFVDNETFSQWWNEFQTFIEEASEDLDLSIYENENLAWARTSFVQPQIMLHDRYLFDRESNQWTVKRYLDDLNERYVILLVLAILSLNDFFENDKIFLKTFRCNSNRHCMIDKLFITNKITMILDMVE